jgi:hypothetical protein
MRSFLATDEGLGNGLSQALTGNAQEILTTLGTMLADMHRS